MAQITRSIVTVPERTVADPENMKVVNDALTLALVRLVGEGTANLAAFREVSAEAVKVGNMIALRSAFLRCVNADEAARSGDVEATVLHAKVFSIDSASAFFEGRMVAVADDFLADQC